MHGSYRLHAHMMFPLFPENWSLSQKCLVVKTSKKCNPLDFKSYPSKLINKNFPNGVMLNFLCFFCDVYWSENNFKITITPYREDFYYLTYRDKI